MAAISREILRLAATGSNLCNLPNPLVDPCDTPSLEWVRTSFEQGQVDRVAKEIPNLRAGNDKWLTRIETSASRGQSVPPTYRELLVEDYFGR